ncbi:hypothetical protein [Psychroserpens algicola]|uniref:Lipocalin-like domain-containing protein n=1 Tax=Psychroserpens algicola TaxID=1719034 RepID=A0ABT0H4Z0_9FLAO|nr:hypothetical protein [Psychroserpens algicola]MCK8479450.1 hypothetical protein [Psychroserpens algicola]
MKPLLLIALILVSITSCSSDDTATDSNIIGSWQLTNYDIGLSVDIDKDENFNVNLLDELNCQNNEVLMFEANGTVSSNDTFNPTLLISKSMNGEYEFDVECAEGSISFASSYAVDNNEVIYSDNISTISDNKLYRTLENVINVYNDDFTQIIETRDLNLIYTKQ